MGRDGAAEPAAMSGYRWVDDRTLEIDVREDNRFADGTLLDVAAVKRSFDELMRWEYPHPPGSSSSTRAARRSRSSTTARCAWSSPSPTVSRSASCARCTS